MSSKNSPSKDDEDSSMYNSALENLTFTSQNGSGKCLYSIKLDIMRKNLLICYRKHIAMHVHVQYIHYLTLYIRMIYNLINKCRYIILQMYINA